MNGEIAAQTRMKTSAAWTMLGIPVALGILGVVVRGFAVYLDWRPAGPQGFVDAMLDQFLGVMLRAPFRLSRDAIVHMKPGSAIINVTSTFAVVGGRRGGAYSAAKGGLTALTQHIACEYGATGIRCNAVAPGVTYTELVAHRFKDERFVRMNVEMTPYPRLGTVEDMAGTIAFLCSDDGAFINGQTIVVDGGWSSTKFLSERALTSDWTPRA
ncbi:MAG: SDR family oxidoreductase [Parvularculaceae bacterium]|nr:SDR family oxidoreductase [Parvularculaceae bacterium]